MLVEKLSLQSSVVRFADADPRSERLLFDCSPSKLPPTLVRNTHRLQGSFLEPAFAAVLSSGVNVTLIVRASGVSDTYRTRPRLSTSATAFRLSSDVARCRDRHLQVC